jgi:hypothetical protein
MIDLRYSKKIEPNETKQKMTTSYKAVFIFSIVMTILMFFLNLIEIGLDPKSHHSGIAWLLWCYQTWLIYKQQNEKLVAICKSLLVILGVLSVSLLVMSFNGVEYSGLISGKFLLAYILMMFIIYYALLKFFKKQVVNLKIDT